MSPETETQEAATTNLSDHNLMLAMEQAATALELITLSLNTTPLNYRPKAVSKEFAVRWAELLVAVGDVGELI